MGGSGSVSINSFTPSYNKDARKVKIKIGTVNDNAILKSLEKREAGALNKLLTYAKSSKAVYTDSLKLSTSYNWKMSDKIGTNKNTQFYYVYYELDDENGKYYPVEDVMLYQAYLDFFLSYLDNDLKWSNENNSTSTPTDTTITTDKKLPQTGEKIAIIGTIGIAVVVTIVLGIKAKKYNF